ncbi:MAG: glycyl-radical enzyme activating protein [Vallitaleaceae bacterium]|nr:glycyl-radical enzyme activating protein [Vallitaleaceae bacterium]
MIFNIQRYSTHDGSGIRTNIFFKGCPIRCRWCSNPESQNMKPEIFFDPKKCFLCLECVRCSKNNEFTLADGKIAFQKEAVSDPNIFKDICPSKAIEVVGIEMEVEAIIKEVKKDLLYYQNSDGGVTITGGDPFFQPALLESLTTELKKLGIHISIETCLNVPWSHIKRSVESIDVFLADLKHIEPLKFKEFTQGHLEQVLANFKELEAIHANVIVRIPVIHGFNDTMEEMANILDFAAGLKNVNEVNFLPYHSFGTGKYTLLGRPYQMNDGKVNDVIIKSFVTYANNLGLRTIIGG